MAFVFVSHRTEDEAVALWLGKQLDAHFLGMATAFVSSDGRSLRAGEPWFATLRDQIRDSRVVIVICTGEPVVQPWVNFEVGAAWALGKVVIPVCVGEFSPEKLDMPLSEVQGVNLQAVEGLTAVFTRIAAELGSRVPGAKFHTLVPSVRQLVADESTDDAADESTDDAAIKQRIRAALTKREKWRTVVRVAVEAGITQEQAARYLRADREVAFGTDKKGQALVGLRSRVHPATDSSSTA